MEPNCVFCRIVAHEEPATYRYEDDDVVVFDNLLDWTRVMMLAVPREHKSQTDLWSDLGAVGRVAMEMGREHAPEGFRIISNFGYYGLQSQAHGHLHILSETESILEPRGEKAQSVVDVVRDPTRELSRTEHAIVYDERHLVREAPMTALAVPAQGEPTQAELWADIGPFGADLADVGWEASAQGFRLLSNFPAEAALPGGEKGHVHILAGAPLGHYA
jgi:histidine triad (HIT) family protein